MSPLTTTLTIKPFKLFDLKNPAYPRESLIRDIQTGVIKAICPCQVVELLGLPQKDAYDLLVSTPLKCVLASVLWELKEGLVKGQQVSEVPFTDAESARKGNLEVAFVSEELLQNPGLLFKQPYLEEFFKLSQVFWRFSPDYKMGFGLGRQALDLGNFPDKAERMRMLEKQVGMSFDVLKSLHLADPEMRQPNYRYSHSSIGFLTRRALGLPEISHFGLYLENPYGFLASAIANTLPRAEEINHGICEKELKKALFVTTNIPSSELSPLTPFGIVDVRFKFESEDTAKEICTKLKFPEDSKLRNLFLSDAVSPHNVIIEKKSQLPWPLRTSSVVSLVLPLLAIMVSLWGLGKSLGFESFGEKDIGNTMKTIFVMFPFIAIVVGSAGAWLVKDHVGEAVVTALVGVLATALLAWGTYITFTTVSNAAHLTINDDQLTAANKRFNDEMLQLNKKFNEEVFSLRKDLNDSVTRIEVAISRSTKEDSQKSPPSQTLSPQTKTK